MISIRRAKPGEADILSQIAIASKRQWNYPEHWMDLWIPQLTFGWAAELDGEAIAFYTLQERHGNAWLENIWVLPKYMGQGVGKELFLHVLSRSRELEYKTLQLEAEPNAVGFYEKMGMRKVSENQYALDGRPRVLPIMEMDL
jgi:GNAT superfamily N-acetyltransferase